MLALRASLVRLTEETTDQFKVDLRVKNESIGIEKKSFSERSSEPRNLSHSGFEGRIHPGQRLREATALATAPTLSSQ